MHVIDRDYVFAVLVCGGRDYGNSAKVYTYLDMLAAWHGQLMVITGGARGADLIAESWARQRQHIYVGFPAQWDKYGKRAGMARNAEMAALSGAQLVVAFYGGRGTRNMVNTAASMDPPIPVALPDGEFWK